MMTEYLLIGPPRRFKNGVGKCSKYYFQKFRLLHEPIRKVRSVTLLTTDSTVARRRAVQLVEAKIKKLHLKRDPHARTAANGIIATLKEYIGDLTAIGNTAKQAKLVQTRITLVITEAKWSAYANVDAVEAVKAINQLIESKAIKTVTTANKFREALRAWSRWMKKNARWPVNVLEDMPKIKGDTTPTRVRAILSDKQFSKLLAATKNGPSCRNLAGEDRFWLYLIASQTGLRAQELHSLKPSSFHLTRQVAYVQIACTVSKRRKTDRIELHPEFAASLRVWLEGKPVDQQIFGSSRSWFYKAAAMLRADLRAAGIPETVVLNGVQACIDFHSFRCYRVTKAILTGANTQVVRSIARLSSEALLDRYAKIPHTELTTTVNSIPVPQILAK